MRFLIFLLMAFHLWLTLVQAAHAESPNVQVTVTGTGPTLELARSDATRQALQLTISQLVVVDREISGNTVLRDRVLSTMNGYIEKFVVRREIKMETEFSVTADVLVSASRIENFIGIVTSGGGVIDGNRLLGEQARRYAQTQAEFLQRKARGEIFDNLLRGFPSKAISIRTTGITLSEKDPGLLRVGVEVSYKESFIKALEGTVVALSTSELPFQPRNSAKRRDEGNQVWDIDILLAGINRFSSRPAKQDIVCLGHPQTIRCYELAAGDYCASCSLNGVSSGFFGILHISEPKGLVTYGRFIDEGGQPVSPCVESLAESDRERNGMYASQFGTQLIQFFIERESAGKERFRVLAGFDFDKKYGILMIPSSLVDLRRAAHFVAVGGLAKVSGSSREVPKAVARSIVKDGIDDYGCRLVDEAVHLRQLEGFGSETEKGSRNH